MLRQLARLFVFFCFVSRTLLAQTDQQGQKRDLEQLLSSVVPRYR